MLGAAYATVAADVLYYFLVVGISCIATRVIPFSIKQTLSLVLIIGLFIANYLWQTYLPIDNIWLDSIIRTAVLGIIAFYIIFKAQLSPEFHALFHSLGVHRN